MTAFLDANLIDMLHIRQKFLRKPGQTWGLIIALSQSCGELASESTQNPDTVQMIVV